MSTDLIASLDADAAGSTGSAVAELIKTGTLGVLLVLAVSVAFYLLRELNKAQTSRIDDQKAVTETLLKFTEAMNGVVLGFKGALEALKTTTDEERKSIGVIDAIVSDNSRTLEQLRVSSEESRRQHDKITDNLQELLRRRGG